jgi:AcrR family transcriptional regulator
MEQALNDTGWRGSHGGWLDAAYETLLESGVDAVRILPLGKKLGLSRTSFYWFFKDREELLATLVAKWRDKNTGNLVKQSEAYAETLVEAMLNVFDCWVNNDLFDARFEFSIRSWALQSDEILAEVQKADQARLEALKQLFIRFGQPETTADVRARTVYLVQIGYISMQAKEDIALRMKRIPEYISIYTGHVPQQRELDRFFARHGHKPE